MQARPQQRHRGIGTRLLALAASIGLAASLTACGGGGNKVTEGAVSFDLPDGWTKTDDQPSGKGWQTKYASPGDRPENVIRTSSDLSLSAAADSTLSVLRGSTLFQNSYGSEFKPVDTKAITVKKADRALAYSFTAKSDDGKDLNGYWFLFSSSETRKTAGIELIGSQVTQEQAEALQDSIRFNPKEQ